MFRKKPISYSPPVGVDTPPLKQVVVDGRVTFDRPVVKRSIAIDAFSLENQLKAGVPLREENCKLFTDNERLVDAFDKAFNVEDVLPTPTDD